MYLSVVCHIKIIKDLALSTRFFLYFTLEVSYLAYLFQCTNTYKHKSLHNPIYLCNCLDLNK